MLKSLRSEDTDADVSEHFGNSLSLNSPSHLTKPSTLKSAPVFNYALPPAGISTVKFSIRQLSVRVRLLFLIAVFLSGVRSNMFQYYQPRFGKTDFTNVQKKKKSRSGHSIRDILGTESSDDEKEEAEKTIVCKVADSGVDRLVKTEPETESQMDPDYERKIIVMKSSPKTDCVKLEASSTDIKTVVNMPADAQNIKSEVLSCEDDEDVSIDVDDEEQLWD